MLQRQCQGRPNQRGNILRKWYGDLGLKGDFWSSKDEIEGQIAVSYWALWDAFLTIEQDKQAGAGEGSTMLKNIIQKLSSTATTTSF